MKKFFQPRHDLTRYFPSLIRLSLGLLSVALSIHLRPYCTFKLEILNVLCSVLLIILGLCGVFQFYMVLCEISFTFDNRNSKKIRDLTPDKIRNLSYKLYSFDEVIEMMERDPIWELSIIFHDRLINIKVSSDSRTVHLNGFKSHEEYFDKRYSIDDKEFASLKDFHAALLPYAENGQLAIHSIDQLIQK